MSIDINFLFKIIKKITYFFHTFATCSELPSIINSLSVSVPIYQYGQQKTDSISNTGIENKIIEIEYAFYRALRVRGTAFYVESMVLILDGNSEHVAHKFFQICNHCRFIQMFYVDQITDLPFKCAPTSGSPFNILW